MRERIGHWRFILVTFSASLQQRSSLTIVCIWHYPVLVTDPGEKSGHGPHPVWLQTLAPSNEEINVILVNTLNWLNGFVHHMMWLS